MPNKFLQSFEAFLGQEIKDNISPVSKWLGGIIKEAEEGLVTIHYVIRHEMTNPLGTIQGGIVAAIMDDVIGAAIYSLEDEKVHVSVNMNIDYLLSARENDLLIATGKIIRHGKRIVNAESYVYTSDHRLMAKSSSNLVITELDKF